MTAMPPAFWMAAMASPSSAHWWRTAALLLHQPGGDMRARDHFGVGGKGERTFCRAFDAAFGELGGDLVQAFDASLPHLGEQGLQAVVVFVKV